MDPERWRRIDSLLQSALDRRPDQRESFLRQECAGDQALEKEVRSLLASHRDAESFLEDPAMEVAARELALDESPHLADPSASPKDLNDTLPKSVGRYRILRLLGEGGMGVVYEAEQDAPLRKVALKLIRPGYADADLLRRFGNETEALGRLQHPGIAQIYDAGSAETAFGRQPYFAMELVRGQTLLTYCDQHRLDTRRRLELAAKICDAVQHAHERGLIHRDLKPANILVDDSGQPRILDFGVARLTDSDARATRQTDLGELVGTLGYMSPEQVLGDSRGVDTRSDVYALGVILYELLAGKGPYVIGRHLREVVRAIREEEPTALSSINRTYRGDIETIVGEALEKDKTRRYASAAEMASDIRRHLRDEPIMARPPSTSYQLQKFARRNKGLVAGVASVLAVLVLGIVASTREAVQARRAEAKAKQQSAIAQAVNDFLQNDLLAQASAYKQQKPDPLTSGSAPCWTTPLAASEANSATNPRSRRRFETRSGRRTRTLDFTRRRRNSSRGRWSCGGEHWARSIPRRSRA